MCIIYDYCMAIDKSVDIFWDGGKTKPSEEWSSKPLMVSVRCTVYNHEPYLRKCLDGFVIQQTNFRFEVIIHEDASTDNSASIIREYAEKYPEIIKPIFQKENQWSKHDGSIRRIMNEACVGKYISVCEGDDYWIDPYKLQMQFDYLESHPDHSLCFHAHKTCDTSDNLLSEEHRYDIDIDSVPITSILLVGGGFMTTNSMFYRKEKLVYYDWMKKSPVGDYVWMLSLALNGKVGYINKVMSCYRVMSSGSWSVRMKNKDYKKKHFKGSMKTLSAFNRFTKFRYFFSVLKRELMVIKWYISD